MNDLSYFVPIGGSHGIGCQPASAQSSPLTAELEIIKQMGAAHPLDATYGLSSFIGSHGIAHTRMATESRVDISHSHPFWARPFPDISVVHNGHITNYHKLRRRLEIIQ